MTSRTAGFLLFLGLALLASGATPGFAEDEPAAKSKPKGPRYVDRAAGVSARGPEGWKMRADASGPVEWSRLVTFNDTATDAQIVFSVRKKTAGSAQALLAKIRKEWTGNSKLRVQSMRAVEQTTLVKIAHVIVDAQYTLRPKAKKGEVAGPPVPYHVNATYFVGPDGEYLLYATAQETHWRGIVSSAVRKARDSIQFSRAVASAPAGGGSLYRNDRYGFTCSYPAGSTVRVVAFPQVVGFQGTDGVTIDVYRLKWNGDLDGEAGRLITFLVEDRGGEAERSDTFVAGKEAALIKGKADLAGGEKAVRYVSFQRTSGHLMRIKAIGPVGQEPQLDGALKAFIDGFKLIKAIE